MTNKMTGWLLFAAAIAMLFGLMAIDIILLNDWHEIKSPTFIGNLLAHISAVLTAFVGGKLIPTEPHNQREGD